MTSLIIIGQAWGEIMNIYIYSSFKKKLYNKFYAFLNLQLATVHNSEGNKKFVRLLDKHRYLHINRCAYSIKNLTHLTHLLLHTVLVYGASLYLFIFCTG